MTPQQAYEADLRARPTYHDGTPRKQWHELGDMERQTWIKNPTPRTKPAPAGATIWDDLCARLGRYPTASEIKEEAKRILAKS